MSLLSVKITRVVVGVATMLLPWAIVWAQDSGPESLAAPVVESFRWPKGRPIDSAVEVLRQKYGLAVNYEDPLYVASDDMLDVTATANKHPGNGRRVVVAAGPPFTFQFVTVAGKPKEDPLALLQRMTAEYAKQGGAVFSVQERVGPFGKQWNIKPVRYKNASGDFAEQPAVLDNVIDIPEREDSINNFLNEICEQLSRESGHKVVVGVAPMNAFSFRIRFAAHEKVAREALVELLDHSGLYTWSLRYNPGLQWDMFLITYMHRVEPGEVHVDRSAQAALAHRNSPKGEARLSFQHLYPRLRTPEGMTALQTALAEAGYYHGKTTGLWDAPTQEAITAFQTANDIDPTGVPDPLTLHKLKFDTNAALPNPNHM